MKKILLITLFLGILFTSQAQNSWAIRMYFKNTPSAQTINTLSEGLGNFSNLTLNLTKSFPNSANGKYDYIYHIHATGDSSLIEQYLNTTNYFDSLHFLYPVNVLCSQSSFPLNDAYFANNWATDEHLQLTQAYCAWNITTGDPNVKIGIVDTDFDVDHEDLVNKVSQIGGVISGGHDHGTQVAGVAGCENNNSKGSASIGYNCALALERVEHAFTSASPTGISDAIWNLYQDGVKIINVSWTGTQYHNDLNVFQDMVDDGVTFVLSSGNTRGQLNHQVVGNVPGVIVVSGVDAYGNHGPTNHTNNPWVDLCALSLNVFTTEENDDYFGAWGTSFAAPQVSATVGLMKSVNPCLTPIVIERILKSCTNPIGDESQFSGLVGTGHLNTYEAVKIAQSMSSSNLDLFIKDRSEDLGDEVNPYHWQAVIDKSPDIWVRNQADGLVNFESEPVEFHNNSIIPAYVYVRVRNKSCQTSTGSEILSLYWSRSSSWNSWPANWDGTNSTIGNQVGSLNIPILEPGEEVILSFPWYISNPYLLNHWGACLLARIENSSVDIITTYPNRQDKDVRYNNNVAMRNVSIVDLKPGIVEMGPVVESMQYPPGKFMFIGNPNLGISTYDIRIKLLQNNNALNVLDEAEVKLFFDQSSWEIIKDNIVGIPGITSPRDRVLLISSNEVEIPNISFESDERIPMYVGFNFLTEDLKGDNDYELSISQYISGNDTILNSQSYKICKSGTRSLFFADAGNDQFIELGESTLLTAGNVSENVVYNWYNSQNELLGSNQSILVQPNEDGIYTLEVIATSDGFKDYDEVHVSVLKNIINSISPNPSSSLVAVDVTVEDNVNNVQLMLMNSIGLVEQTINVNNSSGSYQIDVSNELPGVYSVILICNGVTQDTETIIVQ